MHACVLGQRACASRYAGRALAPCERAIEIHRSVHVPECRRVSVCACCACHGNPVLNIIASQQLEASMCMCGNSVRGLSAGFCEPTA
eukprot:10503060-Alexandrium_andersonii.AAC.2